MHNQLRQLPAVDTLLKTLTVASLTDAHGHGVVVDAIRATLDAARQAILGGATIDVTENALAVEVANRVEAFTSPTLRAVINATGVIVHTNLGRALLSHRAQQAMLDAANAYSNLEYDLELGKRGSRYNHAEALLCRLTGAEAAVVVNNNAAALVLTLSQLALGREVVISRSQLIEIGGGFRIPNIMQQSGAILREVGATNKTYVADYDAALTDQTGLILRVHHSNFKIVGFTAEPSLVELVELGRRYNLPVMDDLGSGTLLDTSPFGLAHEPTIQESLAAGVDVVTASGDKLLGGPQAGLILGRADIIAAIKKHPLIRAFRVDKTTLAALQATLLAYLENKAIEEIPVWRMIAAPQTKLTARAHIWQQQWQAAGLRATVIKTHSAVGGGSLPDQQLPTTAVALEHRAPNRLAAALRRVSPPVIARVEDDHLVLDPRTVLPEQDDLLQRLVSQAAV